MLKLPTTLVKGGFRSMTGYSGFADAVISVFIPDELFEFLPPLSTTSFDLFFLSA